MPNWNVESARQALLEMGEKTDSTLLAKIRENPGLSRREYADSLGWNVWKVHGSCERLKSKGKIESRYKIDNGRATAVLYPRNGGGDTPHE